MSGEIEEGLKDAVIGGIVGVLLNVILETFKSSGSIPSAYIGVFELLQVASFLGGIILIFAIASWGIGYTIGWLLGMGIMAYAGLVENWLVQLYFIVGGLSVFLGVLKKVMEQVKNL